MTDFTAAAEAALAIARERHDAILAEDFDRYDELGDSLLRACASLETASDPPAHPGVFDELLALEVVSSRALQAQAAEVSERLGHLASRSRTNLAYQRSERFSVNGL